MNFVLLSAYQISPFSMKKLKTCLKKIKFKSKRLILLVKLGYVYSSMNTKTQPLRFPLNEDLSGIFSFRTFALNILFLFLVIMSTVISAFADPTKDNPPEEVKITRSLCEKLLWIGQSTKNAMEFVVIPDKKDFSELKVFERARDFFWYYSTAPLNMFRQIKGLVIGLQQVKDLVRKNPLPHNLVPAHHPWVTGINPQTGNSIWHENVIYSTPNRTMTEDEAMLEQVGHFLSGFVKKSVGEIEIPLGPKRRMPHAVNYIHGSSHYNSAILIFNDIAEAYDHFSDQKFLKEVNRLVSEQKREILVYLRDKNYDVQEYAMFVIYVRARLPYFLNSDGPKTPILWGNSAPYPVVNILTGYWAEDLYALRDPSQLDHIARPPIEKNGYFDDGPYQGVRPGMSRWPERVAALYAYYRVRARGRKGNHSTLDRREVDKKGTDNYKIAHVVPKKNNQMEKK